MPQASQVQPSFTFVKGIVTEASPLTFPENATIDEENFDLDVSGKRQRRQGVDFETGYAYVDTGYINATDMSEYVIEEFVWENANNDPSASILVQRVGDTLTYYDLSQYSQSANPITAASSVYIKPTSVVSFSVINGELIIIQDNTNFVQVMSYDGTSIAFSSHKVFVRDIWGVDDSLAVDDKPATLTANHEYNLYNQGWPSDQVLSWYDSDGLGKQLAYPLDWTYNGGDPLGYPTSGLGHYPSNAHIYYSAKTAGDEKPLGVEAYNPQNLDSVHFGTSPAPKGKFLISPFNRDVSRFQSTGLITTSDYTSNGGYSSGASYAGRLFVGGTQGNLTASDSKSPRLSSMVFFSQVANNSEDLAKFYQEADPTAEIQNDLVATDGGFIDIKEALNIHKLIVVGGSLLVFADNGVWQISGGESGFSATDYIVRRITNIGSTSPRTIVNAEGSIFYWTRSGIYAIRPDKSQTQYIAENLTETTIQTLYVGISALSKSNAKGLYSATDRKVRWLYNSGTEVDEFLYDKEIILDLTLGAFYKHSYPPAGANAPQICGFFLTPDFSLSGTVANVTTSTGDIVYDSLSVAVTIPSRSVTSDPTRLKYTCIETPAAGNIQFTFAEKKDLSFQDWDTWGTPVDAAAFMVTGYNISGDSMRYKQVPYVNFHFTRTETGFDTLLDPLNPSSCLVTPYWDFADHVNSGKIGTQFQAYRLTRNYVPTGSGDTFDYGQVVITTKNKLRGRGRAISLRMDSEALMDCQILGWSLVITGNTKV